MGTSDSNITFNARGGCEYCNNHHRNLLPNWHSDEVEARLLKKEVEQISACGVVDTAVGTLSFARVLARRF
jgi:hypothetical protein